MSIQCDRQGLKITNFHLPRTKTAPQGEDVNWAKQDGLADPHHALMNHFDINNTPPNLPLFAYKAKNTHRPLTRAKFLKTLKKATKSAGISPLKGHGISIGSTLQYLLWNVPFEVVKAKGWWASDAFLTYLHKHAQILAPFMQAKLAVHKAFLQLTIPPIRR